MDERLKKRLIGATVLTLLMVIFLPMLFEDKQDEIIIDEAYLPPPPPASFSNAILPAPDADLSRLPDEEDRQQPDRAPTLLERLPVVDEPEVPPAAKPTPPPESGRAQRPVSPSAWVLQVGSFSSRDNAQALVNRLREQRYTAFQVEAQVKGKKVYRVRVGPELNRKRLEDMTGPIEERFKLKSRIMRYP